MEKSKEDGGDGDDDAAFFSWLLSEDSEYGLDLGEFIKEDIWPNPLNYYLAPPVDEDDDDEDGEDYDDEVSINVLELHLVNEMFN